MEPAEEPPPTHARRGEVALAQVALIDRAKAIAGPTMIAEMQERYAWTAQHTGQQVASWETQEVRAACKIAIQKDLTERLKNHPAFKDLEPKPPMNLEPVGEWVKAKINLWADTAGDSSSEAVAMQRAVQEEFGLKDAELRHLGWVDHPIDPEDMARNRAFVRAEYDATQAYLKNKGMTHISLFRGVKDDDDELGYGHETVTTQPASSWTTDLDTALEFANSEVAGHPKVLTTRVPISEVLSSAVTGRGCLSEQEYLVLGRPTRVQVFGMVEEGDVADEDEGGWAVAPDIDATKKKIAKSLS